MATTVRLRVYKCGKQYRNIPEPVGHIVNISTASSLESALQVCVDAFPADVNTPAKHIPQLFLLPGGEKITKVSHLRESDAVVIFTGTKLPPIHLASATGCRDASQVASDKGAGRSKSQQASDAGDDTPASWSLRLDHSIPPIAKFQRAVRRLLLIQRLEGIGASKTSDKKKLSRRSSMAGRNALDGRIKEMVNLYEYNAKRQAIEEKLPRFMMHPEGGFKIVWDIAMLFLVVFFAVMVPYRIGFEIELEGPEADFDFAADILFILDIILSFRTAQTVDGVLMSDYKVIAKDYATTWLPLDVLASFPIGWFVPNNGGAGKINKLFRMLRLVKLFRILRLLKLFPRVMVIIESSIKLNPSILRFLRSFVAMFMLWHFIGCAYYFFVREELNGEAECIAADGTTHMCYVNHCICNTSDPDDFQILEETDINWYDPNHRDFWVPHPQVAGWSYSRKYWTSMFWAVQVTTGVGDDIIPKSNMEIGFTVSMAVIGLMMYAVVIGSATSALQNMDTAATERQQTLDRITQYMRAQKVPTFFQKIIKDFYTHMWSNPTTSSDEVFNELPPNLRSKLTVVVNRDLIDRIPILQTLSADIYIKAVENFKQATFLPGEYIIRQGEVGEELFLIKRGKVDGVLPNGVKVFSTYTPGDYIGEHALLTGNRRDASYRAVDFVDCLVMSRNQFRELTQQAPPFLSKIKMEDMIRQKIRLQAELDYMQDNGLDRLYDNEEDEKAASKLPSKSRVAFTDEVRGALNSGVQLLRKASSAALGLVHMTSSAKIDVLPQTGIETPAAGCPTDMQVIHVQPSHTNSESTRTGSNHNLYAPPFSPIPHTPSSGSSTSRQGSMAVSNTPAAGKSASRDIIEQISDNSDSDDSCVQRIERGSQLFNQSGRAPSALTTSTLSSGFLLSNSNSSPQSSLQQDTKATPQGAAQSFDGQQRATGLTDPIETRSTSQRVLSNHASPSTVEQTQHVNAPSDPTRSAARSVNSNSSGSAEQSPRPGRLSEKVPNTSSAGQPKNEHEKHPLGHGASIISMVPPGGRADGHAQPGRDDPPALNGSFIKLQKTKKLPHRARLDSGADPSPERLAQFDTLLKSCRGLSVEPPRPLHNTSQGEASSRAYTNLATEHAVPTQRSEPFHRRSISSAGPGLPGQFIPAERAGTIGFPARSPARTIFDVCSQAAESEGNAVLPARELSAAHFEFGDDSLDFDVEAALD